MWLATRVCGAMADGRGWRPRVWRWQSEVVGVEVFGGGRLDVVGARVCGRGTWV